MRGSVRLPPADRCAYRPTAGDGKTAPRCGLSCDPAPYGSLLCRSQPMTRRELHAGDAQWSGAATTGVGRGFASSGVRMASGAVARRRGPSDQDGPAAVVPAAPDRRVDRRDPPVAARRRLQRQRLDGSGGLVIGLVGCARTGTSGSTSRSSATAAAEHKSGNYLADSIQIVSIDPEADTTTIIPIPRDFWVEGLPSSRQRQDQRGLRRSAGRRAASRQPARITTEVLSDVTGLEIHHWMAIDFAGFQAMVDAVGGVTLKQPALLPLHLERVEVPAQRLGPPVRARPDRARWHGRRSTTREPVTPPDRRSRATSPDPSASSGSWPRCAARWAQAVSAHSALGYR